MVYNKAVQPYERGNVRPARRPRRPGTARTALCRLAATAMAAAALATSAAQAQSLPVTTTSGTFQGNPADANGVTSFKGIPYAAPPVGPLRWRPPQPVTPAAGVQGAFNFGAPCISPFVPTPAQSENCLTLNVWTPDLNPATPKAVMVWFHGGGFQFGSSALPTYDGSHLASHDVVVVTLNYRLGVLGFLADAQLDAEGNGTSGNYGLEDELAAVQWVKANIRAFGGDPNKVTIFGESGGAHAVGLLLSSPKTRGLVNRAIMQSGAFWESGDYGSTPTHAELLAKGNAFAAMFPGQDLRAVSAQAINAAAPYYSNQQVIQTFGPNVDGNIIPVSPSEAFARGIASGIPLLAGWNASEYYLFQANVYPHSTAQDFYAAAANEFGSRCLPQFQALYPANTTAQLTASAFQLDGDFTISEETWSALTLSRRPGAANAYAYNFTYTSPYTPVASHTAEVPFVFGTLDGVKEAYAPAAPPASLVDDYLSGQMQAYWTNFAKNGDPNGLGLPTWPVYTGVGGQVLGIDTVTPAARANTDEPRFLFLASYRSHGVFPQAWRTLGAPGLQYPGLGCSTPAQ